MNKLKSKKTCMFFASDYHFEMISLLNIRKEIEENKKVIIITENNLEDTLEKLITRVNFSSEEKDKIKNINWTNENSEKFKEIINENKNIDIYVKGSEKHIIDTNKKIEKIMEENKEKIINVIDCYDINEVAKRSNEILDNYKNRLVT